MNSRGLGSARRRAAVAVVLGLVGAGLAGCGFSRNAYADVPQLEVAWTAADKVNSRGINHHVVTEDMWIAYDSESRRLTALRLADGTTAWQMPSEVPCQFSEVNEAGLVAIRTRSSEGESACGHVTLIDTTTGAEQWSVMVSDDGTKGNFQGDGAVGLSDQTVSAPGVCGIERWAVASGKALTPLKGVRESADTPDRCRDLATSNDLALVADVKAVIGYDVDSGKKLWSRPASEPRIGAFYETDPLLVQIQVDGVAGLRQIASGSGELGPLIGRPSGGLGAIHSTSVEVIGERAVGSYSSDFGTGLGGLDGTYKSALRAWDLASGAEQASWTGASGEEYLGVDEQGVYLGREVRGGESESNPAYWVTRSDWSGKPARTVAWGEEFLSGAVKVGDLLIESGYGKRPDGSYGDRTIAYRIPKKTTADPVPAGVPSAALAWEKDDVRPDPTVDPCAGVSDETLSGLGFGAMLEHTAPLDCAWSTEHANLSTYVHVVSPDSQDDAVGNAEQAIQQALDSLDSPVAVDGLGDEAWVSVSTVVAGGPDHTFELLDPSITTTGITVVARQENVVGSVRFTERGERIEGRLPRAAVSRQAGVVAALKEVVDATGGEMDVPEPPSDGPVTQVPDMCDAVADDVRTVLPGAKATDLTATGDTRLRGCLWATREYGYIDSHVQVVAYAVGADPITGATSAQAAEEVFADSRGEAATSRGDKRWDESAMAERSDGYNDASHFVARSGNVIVVVGINLRDRENHVAATVAPRIADRAMKAIRR